MHQSPTQIHTLVQSFAAEAKAFIDGLGEPHPFIIRLLRSLGWQKKDFADFVLRRHAQFESHCARDESTVGDSREARIQKFCHKIWLTSSEEPYLPPEEYLAAYMSMCKGQPSDWTQMFWSNSPRV